MGCRLFMMGMLALIIPWEVEGISCPWPCVCDTIAGADCSNMSLTALPNYLDKDLSLLKASNNSITSLSRFTFCRFGGCIFPQMNQLILRSNFISNIAPTTFEGVKNLRELNLNKNNLSYIDPSVFRNLHKLEKLYLAFNRFTVLGDGIFKELTSLQILELGQNKIEEIKLGAFKGLGSLKRLYLSSNSINSLGNGIFRDLSSLTELDLSFNMINIIKSGVFRGLWSLETLEIMSNSVKSIEKEAFTDLPNLNRLDLDENDIRGLKGSVFKGLDNLETLHLSENKIGYLGSDAFLGLHNLSILYFTSTPIKFIEPSTFQQTPNLAFLFLTSSPNLKLPEEDAFIYSSSMFYLDLSYCNFIKIPAQAFSGLPFLIYLELSNNNLTHLDREVVIPMGERLGQINVKNNPLICDCYLKSTFAWCRDQRVVLNGTCNTTSGREVVSLEAFKNLNCGEDLEPNDEGNVDVEIETFQPRNANPPKVYNSIDGENTVPERTTETVAINRSCADTSEKRKKGVFLTSNISRVTRTEYDRAWSVVLFLSITVCLLLLIIAGLLVSLIFYRRHNRTIIYTMPQ